MTCGKTKKSLSPIIIYCERNQLDIVNFVAREYWGSEVSIAGLAQRWGVDRCVLLDFMQRHGITADMTWRGSFRGRESIRQQIFRTNQEINSYKYSPQFRRLRPFIRTRDDYTCQLCGDSPSVDVHHIDYDTDNNDVLNLITLCCSCHGKTNGKSERRVRWTKHLKELQSRRFKIPLKVLGERRFAYAV